MSTYIEVERSLADAKPQVADVTKRAIAVGIGNFMEWFDFAVYGFFAAIIGQVFFPSAAPGVSLLSSLAVFAVGFISRPLGALILGPIGDRLGSRAVLIITVMGMGITTMLIGLLPGYASIGIAAPILLIILRFTQGMMVGGEWSSAGIYIVESAPSHRRALAASLITGTAGAAFLSGSAVAAILSSLMSPEDLQSWGWRVPFVLSVLMGLIAMYIRRTLGDTPVHEETKKKRAANQLAPILRSEKVKAFVLTCAFSALFGVSLYYLVTYIPNHLISTVGLNRSTALYLCGGVLIFYTALNPLMGILSDKVGRRKLLLCSAVGLTVLPYPVFMMLNTGDHLAIIAGLTILSVVISVSAVMNVVLLVEVFPAAIRSTGAALGYNIALATLAGPGPFIAAALVRATGNFSSPAYYLSAVSFACLIVLYFMLPETKDRNIAD